MHNDDNNSSQNNGEIEGEEGRKHSPVSDYDEKIELVPGRPTQTAKQTAWGGK